MNRGEESRDGVARTTLLIALATLIVAVTGTVLAWLQPSANNYDARVLACANNLRDMQEAVAGLPSISVRMNNDPHNIADLVAESNRAAIVDNAVDTTCPINERVEYIDLIDSSYYRGALLETFRCTDAALARQNVCDPEVFTLKVNTVVACTYSMIEKTEAVAKWSTLEKWKGVYNRWRNNPKKYPDSQTFDKTNFHTPCDITDLDHPERDWGKF